MRMSKIFLKFVPRCSLQSLGVLSIMVDLCVPRIFCHSGLVPRFEQCSVLVKDTGMCAYFSVSVIWH